MRLISLVITAFSNTEKKFRATGVILLTDKEDERQIREECRNRAFEKFPKEQYVNHDWQMYEIPRSLIEAAYNSPPDGEMEATVDEDIWDIDLGDDPLLPV